MRSTAAAGHPAPTLLADSPTPDAAPGFEDWPASGPVAKACAVVRRRAADVQARYGDDRPLLALAGLTGLYSAVTMTLVVVLERRDLMPERIGAADLALYSVATHKLSRILAKDPVASPLRAPFTTLDGLDGPAQLHEEVRGEGWRRAVGELVTCPFCLGQWIGTTFVFGGILAPRATRAIAATFAVHAASDLLQHAYTALEQTTAD